MFDNSSAKFQRWKFQLCDRDRDEHAAGQVARGDCQLYTDRGWGEVVRRRLICDVKRRVWASGTRYPLAPPQRTTLHLRTTLHHPSAPPLTTLHHHLPLSSATEHSGENIVYTSAVRLTVGGLDQGQATQQCR